MSVRRWLAALIVTAIAIIAAAVAFGFIVIPYQTPGSQSVPLTVVARNGPQPLVRTAVFGGLVYRSEAILASPSLADLSTLILAQSGRPDSCPDGNCWRGASVPNSSLLIALPTPKPCRRTALSADLTTSLVLEIHIVAGASDCPPGSLSFASVYWLLAVPRDTLPSSALVIVVDERAQGIGEPLSNLGVWRTAVDLRRPFQSSEGVVSVADLRSALNAALANAEKRGTSATRILEFGLFRLSSGAGLCDTTDSASNENWGAFVVIASKSVALEYRFLDGATVFCRNKSI